MAVSCSGHECPLRLSIEMVPRPLWEQSLHHLLSRSQWDKLRLAAYQATNRHCAVCSAACAEKGTLFGDEVWVYDDVHHVATITTIRAICRMCSLVKHWENTQMLVAEGQFSVGALLDVQCHFQKINSCDESVWKEHEQSAGLLWRERSRWTDWRIDWGEYTPLIEARREQQRRRGLA